MSPLGLYNPLVNEWVLLWRKSLLTSPCRAPPAGINFKQRARGKGVFRLEQEGKKIKNKKGNCPKLPKAARDLNLCHLEESLSLCFAEKPIRDEGQKQNFPELADRFNRRKRWKQKNNGLGFADQPDLAGSACRFSQR